MTEREILARLFAAENVRTGEKTAEEIAERIATESPFDFSRHASIGCGGKAKIAFYPKTLSETVAAAEYLRATGTEYIAAGNLTNVLPRDGDYNGAVLCTEKLGEIFAYDDGKIFAMAGVTANALLDFCQKNGRSGAEFLAGIPCTVGGATYMNAGAQGQYLSDILESVLVYREGEIQILKKEECGFSYKQSVFMCGEKGDANDRDIILGTVFALKEASPERVAQNRKEVLLARRHLPSGKSMGCIFKNPEGDSAGRLIEEAGCKGWRKGGAKVSEKHANFIINDGGATSAEIHSLIEEVKRAVKEKCGVTLEEEIRYL